MKRCIFIALIACITFVMPMTVKAAEAYAGGAKGAMGRAMGTGT